MDIQNSQIGQAFASTTQVASSAQVASPQSADDTTAALEQSRNVSKGVEKIDIPQGEASITNSGDDASKNSVQASLSQADKPERESLNERLDSAVQEVESFLKSQNRNLTFSIDDETKRSIVTVKDSQSGDVIRQIPSEEVLKLAERIQELQQDVGSSVGVFINNEV